MTRSNFTLRFPRSLDEACGQRSSTADFNPAPAPIPAHEWALYIVGLFALLAVWRFA